MSLQPTQQLNTSDSAQKPPLSPPPPYVDQTTSEPQPKSPQSNERNCAVSATRVLQQLQSASAEQAPATGKEQLFNLVMAEDLNCTLTSDYLIKGVLDQGSLSSIYGAPNSAKTFVAMDMAVSIANGVPWHGHKVNQGAVLYISLEGHSGFKRRVEALKKRGKIQPGAPFVTMLQPLHVFAADQIESLVSAVKQLESDKGFSFSLVVVDTLAHAMAGTDENSTKDMMAAVEGLQEIGSAIDCNVMIVHHCGKDASRGSRGNSSLKGAVDSEFECSKVPDTERGFILKTTKQKDMDGSAKFPFTLKVVELGVDEDGDSVTSCVVECVDKHLTASEAAAIAKKDKQRRDMVRLLPQPSMGAWHKEAAKRNTLGENTTENMAKNFVTRHMKKVLDYQSSDVATGTKKSVERGSDWQLLELADSRTARANTEDTPTK